MDSMTLYNVVESVFPNFVLSARIISIDGFERLSPLSIR